ncbi:sirohydrochlorin chelatase [Celerinatantimonas yamalensis]|uniref:CbiX/SirB N-terminal domain-containing protein n=1 Tax=Celerinatantimonas yamalensis TaxID=559956 RepID=A0ABW9GAR2_9GAMM
MSTAFLLVAHGSRRTLSNDEVMALTKQLASRMSECFSSISCAFLELAEPAFESALAGLLEQGNTAIVIFPYFLAAGAHVSHDIPTIVSQLQTQYPNCQITVLAHLGKQRELAGLIEQAVLRSSNSHDVA